MILIQFCRLELWSYTLPSCPGWELPSLRPSELGSLMHFQGKGRTSLQSSLTDSNFEKVRIHPYRKIRVHIIFLPQENCVSEIGTYTYINIHIKKRNPDLRSFTGCVTLKTSITFIKHFFPQSVHCCRTILNERLYYDLI